VIMKKYEFKKEHLKLLKDTSRTLYLSFKILPPYVKYMLGNGYLIARAMDSVVDSPSIEKEEKIEFLNLFSNPGFYHFKKDIEKISTYVSNKLSKSEADLLKKLPDIVANFTSNLELDEISLVEFLLRGLLNGMMIDVERFDNGSEIHSLNTLSELIKYCRLIGGIPAIYWYKVYLKYNKKTYKNNVLSSAYKIGTALQITNILKDIHSDISISRSYIPHDYLESVGLKEYDLKDPKVINKIRPFINSMILMAVNYFDESEYFINSIKGGEIYLKLSLIWPVYWAMDTLYLVSVKNPFKSKIKISRANIYKTLIKSPLLLNPSSFSRGYRFRREILILSLNRSENYFSENTLH
jgi:farnesyl-diphosphate farnesyltransferase